MKFTRLNIVVFSAFALISLSSCNDNDRKADNDQMLNDSIKMAEENRMEQERMERENSSVFAMVQEDTVLTTFSENLESNELSQNFIEDEGPYTIFAPSNVAYEELPAEERDSYNDPLNMEENNARLYYLVVDDEITASELRSEAEANDGTYTLTTMQGEDLTVTLEGDAVVLTDASGNKATIVETDIDATNGVVHVIDAVLVPSDVSTNAAGNMNRDTNTNNRNTTGNTSTGTSGA